MSVNYPYYGTALTPNVTQQTTSIVSSPSNPVIVEIPVSKQPIKVDCQNTQVQVTNFPNPIIIDEPIGVISEPTNPFKTTIQILKNGTQQDVSLTNLFPIEINQLLDTVPFTNGTAVSTLNPLSVQVRADSQTIGDANPLPAKIMITANQIADDTHAFPVKIMSGGGGASNVMTAGADVSDTNPLAVQVYDRQFLAPYNPKLWQFVLDAHQVNWTLPFQAGKVLLLTPLYAECEFTMSPHYDTLWAFERTASYLDKKNPVVFSYGSTAAQQYLMVDEPGSNPAVGSAYTLANITVEFVTLNLQANQASAQYAALVPNHAQTIIVLTKSEGSSSLLYKLCSKKCPPLYINQAVTNEPVTVNKTWMVNQTLGAFNVNYYRVRHFQQSANHSALYGGDLGVQQPNWSRPIIGAFRIDYL